MNTYELWVEGYRRRVTVARDKPSIRAASSRVWWRTASASFIGTIQGTSFKSAFRAWSKTDAAKGYGGADFNPPALWGCRVFDNESDARKRYG